MNPTVNFFFSKTSKWHKEYSELRKIVLECGLTEEIKWGCPCYSRKGSNVVLIHGFKAYCALLFMQGALLKDGKEILVQQTKNVQSARQIRFTNIGEVLKNRSTIKAYIREAIKNDKEGLKVVLKKVAEYKIPLEFKKVLGEMPEIQKAFKALTPGRQRGYLLHFAAPKQVKSREARVEKYLQKILDGKGLDD